MPTNEIQENEQPKPEPTLGERFDRLEGVVGKLAGAVAAQQKTIAALAERPATPAPADAQAPAAEEPPPGIQTLPEGTVRFFSPFKLYGIWMERAEKIIVDGRAHHNHGRFIEFNNGIYETSDEHEIEFLRNCSDFGRNVIEDPTAQPHPGPTVVEGPRTTPQHPTGRAREELAARL
jgi:hypothetical protein